MFDFEKTSDKSGMGSLKYITTPDNVKTAGVVSYSGAEMEFATAPSIIKSITEYASNGAFVFTLADSPYRNAVRGWMKSQRGAEIQNDWIVPTLGTIFSAATAIRLFTRPGEGIIVSAPVYYRYEQAAERLGRKTLHNQLINNNGRYEMDFDGLERLMADPANKLYILCNPHNPVGKVWDRDVLERIAELANKYGVIVFSDEIFAEVTFNSHPCIPFHAVIGGERSIVCTSLGKTFNMTGVNHANVIIPDEELREAFIKQRYADHFGSVDPFFYAAVIGAYSDEGAGWKDAMVSHVYECYETTVKFFKENLPKVVISPLEGTFVLWLDWRALFKTDGELMTFLRDEALMFPDLGSDYGSEEGFTRLSIAVPKRELEKSLTLLLKAAEKRGLVLID